MGPPGWTNSYTSCLAASPDDGVWGGTQYMGLFYFHDRVLQTFRKKDGLASDFVRTLFVTPSGDVWLGTDAPVALQRLRHGEIKNFVLPPECGLVTAMVLDAAGTFWIATADGLLLKLDAQERLQVVPTGSDSPEPIRCLQPSADGSLWIGYAGRGVGRFKNGRLARYHSDQGLLDDYISQLVDDGRGRLWLAGNRGLCSARLREFDELDNGRISRVRCLFFGPEEGLPNLQASHEAWPGALRSREGVVCVPTAAGVAMVHAEALPQSLPPPPIVLERAIVDGRILAAYRLDAAVLDPTNAFDISPRQPDPILKVPAGYEQLRFEFTALGLADPRNIYFRYRLEGSDAEWVNAGQERFAQYSHIPPGSYSFWMTACQGDGVWSPQGTVLRIQVLPHFWQTWWFRVAARLVCIAAVAGAARHWATKKLQRQLEEAKQASAIERERTRIAKDIHDDLGANLTEITLLSELAQSAEAPAAEARADVRAIAARARELTRALDATVWAVDPVKDSLESLVSYTCAYAEDYLRLAGIRCRLDLPQRLADRPLAPEARHNLFLVTKEALHNIVKHSAASEAQIQIAGQNGLFKLAILDNGKGFQPQTFDATQNGFIPKGRRGNGLQNMRKRIEDLGGSYLLTSEPGKGTRIEISVPLP